MADEPNPEAGPFDVQTIRFLANLMSRHDLNEIDLREGDSRIRLLRGVMHASAPVPVPQFAPPTAAPSAAPPNAAPAAEAPAKRLLEIKSELVATFYARPNPDAEPYVHVGSRVQPDTVVGQLEAMKLYSEVLAGCSGVIAEIAVENQQPVEYGTVLFRVDPNA